MTNLDALHFVHQHIGSGTYGRQWGKTFYQCHVIAVYLEVLHNETIIVVLPALSRVDHFRDTLEYVFEEHDIRPIRYDKGSLRYYFYDNTNCVKIMTPATLERMHPIDTGASPDQYPIFDLEEMPASFTNANITVRDFHKVLDYVPVNKTMTTPYFISKLGNK